MIRKLYRFIWSKISRVLVFLGLMFIVFFFLLLIVLCGVCYSIDVERKFEK